MTTPKLPAAEHDVTDFSAPLIPDTASSAHPFEGALPLVIVPALLLSAALSSPAALVWAVVALALAAQLYSRLWGSASVLILGLLLLAGSHVVATDQANLVFTIFGSYLAAASVSTALFAWLSGEAT